MHILKTPTKYTFEGSAQGIHSHLYSPAGLTLLSLAVGLSTFADRILGVSLGAGVILSAPPDLPGLNVAMVFGPLIALALPLSIAGNALFSKERRLWLLIQLLGRCLLAVVLCFPSIKQLLAATPLSTAMVIALIFLGSQLSLATALAQLRQFTVRPLPYLAASSAAFFLAQGLAMSIAPQLLNQTSDMQAACAAILYLLASWLFIKAFEILAQIRVKEDFNREALAIAEEIDPNELLPAEHDLSWWQLARYLVATAVLFMPLFAPTFAALLFALQGQQAGSLILSQLCANLSYSCAFGSLFSIYIGRLARKRIILQVVAATALLLFSGGAIGHNFALSYGSLTAMAAIAGLLSPDWYHHLFTHVSSNQIQHFLAGKDTAMVSAYCLICIPLANSLTTVSSLYFLKELNLIGAVLTLLAVLTAPLMLSVLNQSQGR